MTKLIYILLILCLAVPGWAGQLGETSTTSYAPICFQDTLTGSTFSMTADSNGVLDSFYVYGRSSVLAQYFWAGIYSAWDNVLIDSVRSGTDLATSWGWCKLKFPGTDTLLAGSSYVVSAKATHVMAGLCSLAVRAGSVNSRRWTANAYASAPPNPWSASSDSIRNVCMYVTYDGYATGGGGRVIYINIFGNYTIDNHWFCNLMRESLFRSFN